MYQVSSFPRWECAWLMATESDTKDERFLQSQRRKTSRGPPWTENGRRIHIHKIRNNTRLVSNLRIDIIRITAKAVGKVVEND
jgi:hypothetical protein